jgi:uncharacterized repeat protein (TIGR02543 family)
MRHNTFKLALAIVACLSVFSFAQIPVLRITTQNNQEPSVTTICTGQSFNGFCMGSTSTNMNYVKINSFALEGAGSSNFTSNGQDSIRIRGNSTAEADKKPYRIKFGEKKSMFNLEAARSWVLLAEYYDGTFALNHIAFRLGKKMGLDFTHTARHVEVIINNQSKGIYTLTEQNQVNPGRVDIRDKKDWLAEFDYHPAAADEIKFNTAQYNLPTFIKSPEVERNFNVNNPDVKFVVDELNALTRKMAENNFPENGYRDLMDLDSWAKYVLIQQLMDNFDFNSKVQDGAAPGSNFCYRDSTGKVKAGPLWDFDLSAGVTAPGMMGGMGGMGTFPAHYQTTTEAVEPKHQFYKRLWADPVFKAKFKKLFDKHKSDFDAIPAFIDSISSALGSKVGSNNKWANNSFSGSANLTQQAHNTEVNNLKNWWRSRVTWFGQQIANFDTSKDIATSNTVTVTFDANGGSPTPATQTVTVGQRATQPSNPSRSGYTFGGWFTDGGSSTGTFADQWNFNTAVTSKMTLYAKWTSNGGNPDPNPPPQPSTKFTVTFNTLSNSASPAPQAQSVDKDGKATEPAPMTRSGTWTFVGWYKDNGTWEQKWNFATDVVTADIILYAYWKSTTQVTVTFNTNGGSNIASVTIAEGEKVSKPADPTRSGFIFSGWYKDAAFTVVWSFDSDLVNANTTIYAKWSEPGKETYTVTFNTGGSNIPAQTVNTGEKATQPANPTRQGYAFEGWTKYDQTPWNFLTDVVTANTTIYAKWSVQQERPIDDPPSFAIKQQLPLGKISSIKNGLAINAAGSVSITVFSLKGNVVSKQAFASGNHAVKFDNLPRGMYIVKASFGNGASPVILRLPIR